MNKIEAFKRELQRRVTERDPFAVVKIVATPKTAFDGEYLCLIETFGNVEMYAFSPSARTWIAVYNV